MSYKLKCNDCSHVFVASSRSAQCPRHASSYQGSSFIGEVLETAVEVAVAYVVADAVMDVAGSVFDSFFD